MVSNCKSEFLELTPDEVSKFGFDTTFIEKVKGSYDTSYAVQQDTNGKGYVIKFDSACSRCMSGVKGRITNTSYGYTN